jgi:hypothetical protein
MIQAGIVQCINSHPGQPDVEAYCTCVVNRWVGLWSEDDRITWSRTGMATEHMQEMEAVAARQCGGR